MSAKRNPQKMKRKPGIVIRDPAARLAEELRRLEDNPVLVLRDILAMFADLQGQTTRAIEQARIERIYRHEAQRQLSWVDGMLASLAALDSVRCTPKAVRQIVWDIRNMKPPHHEI